LGLVLTAIGNRPTASFNLATADDAVRSARENHQREQLCRAGSLAMRDAERLRLHCETTVGCDLGASYEAALERYVDVGEAVDLDAAHAFSREAFGDEMSVLDVVGLHRRWSKGSW
jgi:hypothetical protein